MTSIEDLQHESDKIFYTAVSKRGDNIRIRGYNTDSGQRFSETIKYSPTWYLRKSTTKTPFKDIYGNALVPRSFETMSEAHDFKKRYEGVEGHTIYGDMSYTHAAISDIWKSGIVPWDYDRLRIFMLDIENIIGGKPIDPLKAATPITVITVHDSLTKKYNVFAYKEDLDGLPDNVVYQKFPDEKTMLVAFMTWWTLNYPDMFSGWNVSYDSTYIVSRINRLFGPEKAKCLSPWGSVREKTRSFMGKEKTEYEIQGIAQMDIMDLMQKYGGSNQESWKLDYIARVVLGEKEGKVEYSEYSDLDELYEKDFHKYVIYNIRDVELVLKIENKMEYIPLICGLTYDGQVESYPIVFGPVRYFETYIGQFLKRENTFFPYEKRNGATKDSKYEGAYVSEPVLGEHHWVISQDAASLYPNTIINIGVSPECLVHDLPNELQALADTVTVDKLLRGEIDLSVLKQYNLSFAPNGAFFRRDIEGFLPRICKHFLESRNRAKKEMLKVKSENEQIKAKLLSLGVHL